MVRVRPGQPQGHAYDAAARNPAAPSATATTSHGSISTGADPTICEPGDSAAVALNSSWNRSRASADSKT